MPRNKDQKRVVRTRMAATGERYTEAREAIRPEDTRRRAPKRTSEQDDAAKLVEVEIPVRGGIRVRLATNQHFVVLKQRDGDRSLPIWIGMAEANAIAVALSEWKVERPITSDLLTSTIHALGGTVDRVVITRFEAGCFYAEVHVNRDGAALPAMDARPSDALGIAVRTHAPIFVAADVMDVCGSDHEPMPDGVAVTGALARIGSEGESRTIALEPVVEPTHMLIDAAANRVVTLLRFTPGVAQQPEEGTLITVGTSHPARQYRVLEMEAGSEGLTRLRAELVATPTHGSSHVITTVPPASG